MNKMGMQEFKQYLDAPQLLAEKERDYRLFERRGYADIHPTRIGYDHGMGKMFKESLHVEDYVIWLIESKDIIKEQVHFWEQRVAMLQKAINTLSDDEWLAFNDFRQEKEVERARIEPILMKLKAELEILVSIQLLSMVQQPSVVAEAAL